MSEYEVNSEAFQEAWDRVKEAALTLARSQIQVLNLKAELERAQKAWDELLRSQ